MSKEITHQLISQAMFERLAVLENEVEKIDALVIITVHDKGITPDIFYKPGGRLLLLAGLELAKTDLIDMLKQDKNGQAPIVDIKE